jgi:hypothetical protein
MFLPVSEARSVIPLLPVTKYLSAYLGITRVSPPKSGIRRFTIYQKQILI